MANIFLKMKQPKSWRRVFQMNRSSSRLVPRVKGVGVVLLFHMKELQLGLHKYMKMKLSLPILFFLYQ